MTSRRDFIAISSLAATGFVFAPLAALFDAAVGGFIKPRRDRRSCSIS